MWTRFFVTLVLLCLPSFAWAFPLTELQNAATVIGNGTPATVFDKGTVGVTVTGSFTGMIVFKGSADGGTTYSNVTCTTMGTGVQTSSTSAIGQFLCPTSGLSHFIARIEAISAGSITAVSSSSLAPMGGGSAFTFDSSGNLSVTMGTLLSCEKQGVDQDHSSCHTDGAVVRAQINYTGSDTIGNVASGLLIGADCTSHCTPAVYRQLPIGPKTFTSTIVSATSGDTVVAQVHTLYGANINTATSDDAVKVCTVTFAAATQYLTKKFTQSCPTVTLNYLYWFVISSGTGSGAGVVTGDMTATY